MSDMICRVDVAACVKNAALFNEFLHKKKARTEIRAFKFVAVA